MAFQDIIRAFAQRCSVAFNHWLAIEPNRRRAPTVASMDGSEALVSGDYVVELIVESIKNRVPVVLSGPRGCGKSWCVFEAVERAVERGIVPGTLKDKKSWGFVFAQGNKELPREYLMEDEARIGGTGTTVSLFRKEAPMLRFAERDLTTGELKQFDDGSLQSIWQKTQKDPSRPFVLFLDEVNRFSDGVLDSLLLLLEERKIVRDGKPMKVDCAVAMTMNPPGYDGTAKRLSPPLQARLGRVVPLCTPDFTTTYDISRSSLPIGTAADDLALKRACLASIALWGTIEEDSAAYRYLTPQSRILLAKLAEQPALVEPMALLGKECSYGPDVRGVRYWVSAALGRRASVGNISGVPLRDALQYCFDSAMLHRLSTRFVEASSAAKLSQVENAARVICDYVLMLPDDSPYLRTVYDEIGKTVALVLETQWGLSLRMLRASWHASGRSSDADLVTFAHALVGGTRGSTTQQILDELEQSNWIEPGRSKSILTRRAELAVLAIRTRAIQEEMNELTDPMPLAPMWDQFAFGFAPSLFSNSDAVEQELQKVYDLATGFVNGILNDAATPADKAQYAVAEVLIQRIAADVRAHVADPSLQEEAFKKDLADDLMECNRRLQDWVSLTASLAAPPASSDATKTAALDATLHSVLSILTPPVHFGGRRLSQREIQELIQRLQSAIEPVAP